MPDDKQTSAKGPSLEEGYQQAISLLSRCCSPDGFLASFQKRYNYHRIWGRDGAINSLAALLTGHQDLIDCGRRTLLTLAKHQGPHGEIPSNVDPLSGRISYGGTVGRVDSNLWFLIGCGEYWQRSADEDFLDRIREPLERVVFLLGAWEFNNRGLIYVPATGDWADEYVHNGYILYDQLLYFRALRAVADVRRHIDAGRDHFLEEKICRLGQLIKVNYWLAPDGELPPNAYHEVIYKKLQAAACHCEDRHWLPFFTPLGYGYRFDSFANVLASLFGLASGRQQQIVDDYIDTIVPAETIDLLPAFHPVISPKDEDWQDLNMTFSYTFKNKPYEFQNGGLWPLITGLYVADLARRGEQERAERFLHGVCQANSTSNGEGDWLFPEFIHGKTFKAGGTVYQAWNAASFIIGYHALQGDHLFGKEVRRKE
mgnify:CR=1 FL=1